VLKWNLLFDLFSVFNSGVRIFQQFQSDWDDSKFDLDKNLIDAMKELVAVEKSTDEDLSKPRFADE